MALQKTGLWNHIMQKFSELVSGLLVHFYVEERKWSLGGERFHATDPMAKLFLKIIFISFLWLKAASQMNLENQTVKLQ